jgi:hypothetical protein
MRYPLTRVLVVVALFGLVAVADAAEERSAEVPPPPPPPQESPKSTSPPANPGALEPEITITSKGSEIHEEYRYNGVLYMVKVIPKHGPPYYLVYDERGRARRSDLEPDIIVPQWVIKRF